MGWSCAVGVGVARKLLVGINELRGRYCEPDVGLCLKVPGQLPYRNELSKFLPELYHKSQLVRCFGVGHPESFVVVDSSDNFFVAVKMK